MAVLNPTELQKLPAPHSGLVSYIAQHPGKPLTEIINPYRKFESQLRKIFAQNRENPVLNDHHVNLLPLFTDQTEKIKTRARNLATESREEKGRFIMALPDDKRRADGSPAVVQSLREFRENFTIFSESSLATMNWSNVVAAGSSVVNCIIPIPEEFKASESTLRDYYHNRFCPASDVDLFLYGLDEEKAVEKIKHIEKAIRTVVQSKPIVVRTKHAITIATKYPTRHVQIVLRLYKSPSEILAGFDIDAAAAAYDGEQVWVSPRALQSYMTQINHIDLTRRSPSYETRLSKYSRRNFEVYWAPLDRKRVDPTIFERRLQKTFGLARLLVLERFPTSDSRELHIRQRRRERGRPPIYKNHQKRSKGGIKDLYEDEIAEWADEEDSNYHTFTVPYGQQYDAERIQELCNRHDRELNAKRSHPKDRDVYLHRHPAFSGTLGEVIEDCCGRCPVPANPKEMDIAEKESKRYVSGKITFIVDEPGRQQIGSFHPFTDDDWTDMAYIGNTARLCQSIADKNAEEVLDWLSQEGADPNKRDCTGTTPLALAIRNSPADIVRYLVDRGAQITSLDKRLAAKHGNAEVMKILEDRRQGWFRRVFRLSVSGDDNHLPRRDHQPWYHNHKSKSRASKHTV